MGFFARKHLFYLTNQQLVAYAWHGGTLERVIGFDNDDAGRLQFGAYLEHAAPLPSCLLVDVVEEDFQRDSAPHVSGRARQAMLERKLAQLYRDTPFRHAELQGRDKTGRKDDRYLFNALTNAELPRAWLAVMLRHAVPLAGVYSLASLSQVLFNKLKLPRGPVLLVSHQSSGLRQSFFDDGQLRFSRLTPLFDHAPERLAEAFRLETAKTRQFMASTRLLARGAQVTVTVLASEATLALLAPDMASAAEVRYLPLESAAAGRAWAAGAFDSAGNCDPLYLALLAKAAPATHFALRDQRHFYQLLQARASLYALAGAVALAALVWVAIDLVAIVGLRGETARYQQEAAATELRYQAVVHDMPKTAVTPHNMKSVVDIDTMVSANVPLPTVQMAEISQVLNNLPQLKIRRLRWEALDGPGLAAMPLDGSEVPVAPGDFPPTPGQLGLPARTAQVVRLEGEVLPFQGDYRSAINAVLQLTAQLNRNPALQAEVTQQPIDTRPTVKLASKAGDTTDVRAPFAVKVTWKP